MLIDKETKDKLVEMNFLKDKKLREVGAMKVSDISKWGGFQTAKAVIDQINSDWYYKKLCDKRGWKEIKPITPTKKLFRKIRIYHRPKGYVDFSLSFIEYKCYRVLLYLNGLAGVPK